MSDALKKKIEGFFKQNRDAAITMAIIVLAALAVAAGVTELYRRADRLRQAQVLVADIAVLGHDLYTLQAETELQRVANPDFAPQIVRLHTEIFRVVKRVEDLTGKPDGLKDLRSAIDKLEADMYEWARLAAKPNGRIEAFKWDQERVKQSHASLMEVSDHVNARFSQEARYDYQVATVGSTLFMALAAILMGSLFLRYERARRATDVLATEQRALRDSEERFRSLVRNARDVILILNEVGVVRYSSPAVRSVMGYAPEELVGQSALDFIHPDDAHTTMVLLTQILPDSEVDTTTEVRFRHATGSWRQCELALNNLLTDPGVSGLVATVTDVTERKAFEEELARLAFRDTLTDLPNRALFIDRLRRALSRADRRRESVAVLLLDLDNFKVINDSLGHQVGDSLLIAAADRLRSSVSPDVTIARFGGDEFAVLLEEESMVAGAQHIANRIAEKLRAPFIIGGSEIFITASVGIVFSRPGDEPDGLLRDGALAVFRAKASGKDHHELFDRTSNAEAVARLELEADMRRAIEKGEFRVYYQPIVCLDTDLVAEMEALVRWQHPRRGLVHPLEFIPLAEESGLILQLGTWVLREACRQAAEWHAKFPTLPPTTVNVNLSVRQVQDPDLVNKVGAILEETGLFPGFLKLEITESVMMSDGEAVVDRLKELREMGVCLALDDFGTGFSSLSYLERFPIDSLKVDRSFVLKLGQGPQSAAIVHAVIMLAHALNLKVTAEGIETQEQLAQLRLLGCAKGQGYFFARPLPAEETSAFIRNRSGGSRIAI